MNVSKPFTQIPMWHRKGGVIITTASKALRIGDQDWSELTLEAFAADAPSKASRRLVSDGRVTMVELITDQDGNVEVGIATPEGGVSRSWRLRVHLSPAKRVTS